MRTQDIIKQEVETTVASEPVNVSNDSIFEPVVECREYPFKISDDDADFILKVYCKTSSHCPNDDSVTTK